MLKRAPRTRKPWIRRVRTMLAWIWQRVVNQHDAAERVALGAALGFFIGWLPLVGVQTWICLGLCALLRANFLATIPGVWLSNPFTLVPMYMLENRVGALVAGQAITWQQMEDIWREVGQLGIMEGTRFLFTQAAEATLAMFIGGALIGLVNAFLAYPFCLWLIRRYQARRLRRRAHWKSRLRPAVQTPEPQQAHSVEPAGRDPS